MTRVIKKYPNRRLYDTSSGSYITLDDVKELVFKQVDFKVIEARSGKDLTKNTLLQIITEHETKQSSLFTKDTLQTFIRFYHEKSHETLSKYLEEMMNLFMQQRDYFQKQWSTYQQFLNPTNPFLSPKDKKPPRPGEDK